MSKSNTTHVGSEFAKQKRTTIIFFPGFLKSAEDFDITEQGKQINITKCINKMVNTYVVSFSLDDYCKSIDEVCINIMEHIKTIFEIKKILLVGHSFGSFYALKFAELFNSFVKGILLIDPTYKSETYLTSLKSKLDENINILNSFDADKIDTYEYVKLLKYNKIIKFKINNFISYPHLCENHNFYVTILLNKSNNNDLNFIQKERHFTDFVVCCNSPSKIMIYNGLSHMIHYKRPDVIIKEIKNLLSLIREN